MQSKIFIISGPAGSGKNTVAEALIAEFPNVERVITSTSRAPRGAEKNGIDYNFLSRESFELGIQNGDFYEYAKVHNNYYGTSKKSVSDALERGKDLLLIIDVQGARAWKKIGLQNPEIGSLLKSVFIFLDREELEKRMIGRGTEDSKNIAIRLKTAEDELKCSAEFDEVIHSGTREEDYAALREIYLRSKLQA